MSAASAAAICLRVTVGCAALTISYVFHSAVKDRENSRQIDDFPRLRQPEREKARFSWFFVGFSRVFPVILRLRVGGDRDFAGLEPSVFGRLSAPKEDNHIPLFGG